MKGSYTHYRQQKPPWPGTISDWPGPTRISTPKTTRSRPCQTRTGCPRAGWAGRPARNPQSTHDPHTGGRPRTLLHGLALHLGRQGAIQRNLPKMPGRVCRADQPGRRQWWSRRGCCSACRNNGRTGVVHGFLRMVHVITKIACRRHSEGPPKAYQRPFGCPVGMHFHHYGVETDGNRLESSRVGLIGAAVRSLPPPPVGGVPTDLYSLVAVRPRCCDISRRWQAHAPACGGSQTVHSMQTCP